LLICVCLLFLSAASAGGSWEWVTIESFKIFNSTDYELVVVPTPEHKGYKDPYMANCPRFIMKGTYSWLHSWRFPDAVKRKKHKAALAYLQQALNANNAVLLGWMGTGFVPIDPGNKCVVRSRALQLLIEDEVTAVISYHNAV
jgi:hypothetical protein